MVAVDIPLATLGGGYLHLEGQELGVKLDNVILYLGWPKLLQFSEKDSCVVRTRRVDHGTDDFKERRTINFVVCWYSVVVGLEHQAHVEI